MQKTTIQGNNLSITDISKLPMTILPIGNSTQKTSDGRNILDIDSSERYVPNSTSFNIIDKNKVSVISDNNATTSFVSFPINVKSNTDYTFSGIANIISNSVTEANSIYVKVREEKNSGNWVSSGQALIDKNNTGYQNLSLTFNTGNFTVVWVWLYIKSSPVSGIVNINFFDLQVEEGTEKTNPEEFGISPSLGNPSKIENLGDNINFINENEPLNYNTYGSSLDNTVLQENSSSLGFLFECEPNTTYYFSRINTNGNRFRAFCFDEDPTKNLSAVSTNGFWNDEVAGYNGLRSSFTTTSNSRYIYLFVSNGTTAINNKYKAELNGFTPYSPYNCGSIGVYKYNMNIANIEEIYENMKNYRSSACNRIVLEDKNCIRFSNTVYRPDQGFNLINYKYKENTSYTIRGLFKKETESSSGTLYFQVEYTDGTRQGTNSNDNDWVELKLVTDSSKTIKNVGFSYGTSAYWLLDESSIFISKGDVSNYIEQQGKQETLSLQEGQKLMLGDYPADDGIHHVRKQVELNGTEDWRLSGKQFTKCASFYLPGAPLGRSSKRSSMMCNQFIFNDTAYNDGLDIECITNNGISDSSQDLIVINVSKDKLSEVSVDGFKSLLADQKAKNMPVIVEFELGNEIIDPYVQQQELEYNNLNSVSPYFPVTNIRITPDIGKCRSKLLFSRRTGGRNNESYMG